MIMLSLIFGNIISMLFYCIKDGFDKTFIIFEGIKTAFLSDFLVLFISLFSPTVRLMLAVSFSVFVSRSLARVAK